MMRDADAFLAETSAGKAPAHQLFTTMGFLEKKGGSTKADSGTVSKLMRKQTAQWHRRFFVLQVGAKQLTWYESSEAYHAGETEAGSFELAAGARFFLKEVGAATGLHRFSLASKDGRELKLRCSEKDEYEKWAKPLRALCPDADAEAAEARLASRSAKFRADVGEMKKVLAGVLPKETTEGYLEKKRGGKKGEGEGDDFESGALPALLTDGSMGLSSCETLPRPSDTTAAGSPVVSGALPAMEKKASSVESSTGVVKALETATGALWRKRYFVLTRSHLSYFSKAPAASSATGREGSRRRGTVNAERSSVDPRPSGAHFGEPSSHPADKSVLALGELHVIPSGTGAEFSLEMKERVVRLRAADAKDAAAWVAALMSLQMASGQSVVGSTGDDETRLAGLVAPDVVVSVWDDARNDIVELQVTGNLLTING